MNLTSKDRMLITLDHKEPDRVPLDCWLVPEIELLLRKRYKKELEEFDRTNTWQDPRINPNLWVLLGNDILIAKYGISSGYYRDSNSDFYLDEWRIKWKKTFYKTVNGDGYYTEISEFPLSDENKINNYIPPNPDNEDMWYIDELIKRYGDEYYIVLDVSCSIFEALKYLRGITQSLIDIIVNKDIAHKVMDMAIDYHLKLGLRQINKGVDMILLADDFGGEDSLLMSPELFREMIKPKMGYMINEFKKKNKNIKIGYHCCGYVEPIIDDFIEVGIDLLHPIQPEAMDPAYIKKRYGSRVALWGTIGTQQNLPFGSPRDVENEVKERIKTCGPGGGFLISPSHSIQLDVPLKNIEAFYNAVKKYGKYPIKL